MLLEIVIVVTMLKYIQFVLARLGGLVTQRPWVARVSPVTRVEEGHTALLPCR